MTRHSALQIAILPHLVVVLALFLSASPAARAEHAKITLDVKTATDQKTAYVDQTPPPSGKNPRPVLKARAGEPIKVECLLTNVYPHKTLENVVIHFYVARIDEIGQKDLPDLESDRLVLETAFDMDLKPGGHAGARTSLSIPRSGVYLVRIESRQTQSDHEHFAAIDLVIEDAP
jgi:hypothetical protein